MRIFSVALLTLFLFAAGGASAQNNPPLNLEVMSPDQVPQTRSSTYRKLTPQEAQSPVYDDGYTNRGYRGELPFDGKGERNFEGFAFDLNERTGEFKVHTSEFGEIKAKLARNTEFIPSKSAFKEGCYIMIKQRRNLNAESIEIPAIWDAKKRPGWHSFSGALK